MITWFFTTTLAALILAAIATLAIRLARPSAAIQHALWLLILVKMMVPSVLTWPATPWNQALSRHVAHLTAQPTGILRDIFTRRSGNGPTVTHSQPAPRPPSGDSSPESNPPSTEPGNSPGPQQPFDPQSPPALTSIPTIPDRGKFLAEVLPPSSWEPTLGAGPALSASTHSTRAENNLPIEPARNPRSAGIPWRTTLILVWGVGALMVLVRQARQIAVMDRLCGETRPASAALRTQTIEVARRMRLKSPGLRVSEQTRTPFLWCLGRPKLIWPSALEGETNSAGRPAILAHELAHLARRDHWVAWLLMAAECVWWWNPVFYFVRSRLREAAELACDAWAIWALPAARHAYAVSLVDISATLSRERTVMPALGVFGAHRHSFERRLTMIMKGGQRHRLGWLTGVGLAVLGMVLLPNWSTGQESPASSDPTLELNVSAPALLDVQPRAEVNVENPVQIGVPPVAANVEFNLALAQAVPAAAPAPPAPVSGTLQPPNTPPVQPGSLTQTTEPRSVPVAGGTLFIGPGRQVVAAPPTTGHAYGVNWPGSPPGMKAFAVIDAQQGPMTIRVFRLTHQKAEKLKPIVEHVLGGGNVRHLELVQRGGEPATVNVRPGTAEPASRHVEAIVQLGLTHEGSQFRLVADTARNVLIARAPEEPMGKIAEIVKAFDVPDGEAVGQLSNLEGLKVLNFSSGTVDSWLEMLDNLGLHIQVVWRSDATGDQVYLSRVEVLSEVPGVGQVFEHLSTGESTTQGGTIIISGDEETLKQAESLVQELDSQQGQPGEAGPLPATDGQLEASAF